MAIDVGAPQRGKGGRRGLGARPEMNVTPLVDVVLVLLIIFMVVTPMLGKQLWVHYPDRSEANEPVEPSADDEGPVVVSVRRDGRVRINRDLVADEDLARRVRRVLAARGGRTVFFDAAEGASFGRAVAVMDLVREAGATTIAVATEELE